MERIKLTFFLLVLGFTGVWARANEIDDMRTFDDVNKFAREHVYEDNEPRAILEPNMASKSKYGKDSFHKVDLDNDGLTDLIIDGEYLLAIHDEGNGKYGVHLIDRGSFALVKYSLANITYEGKAPLLFVKRYDPEREAKSAAEPGSIVSLPITGERVGQDPGIQIRRVYRVQHRSVQPQGRRDRPFHRPVFPIMSRVQAFRLQEQVGTYNSIQYSGQAGRYKVTIDQRSFNDLVNTINYMGLTKLKDEYAVGWTDDQGATLRIKYNNGKIKKISDYGMIGTFGLENLYNQILNLRNTQKWVR